MSNVTVRQSSSRRLPRLPLLTPARALRVAICALITVMGILNTVTLADQASEVARRRPIRLLMADGGRMDWSHARDVIAFDHKGPDGYYDVYTIRPDGSDRRCVTCNIREVTARHVGQPAWHPSGEYLAVQAEKPRHRGSSLAARPGLGLENDVWIVAVDGDRAFRVTNLRPGSGILHPRFSSDGRKLIWAERVKAGSRGELGFWQLQLAEVSIRRGNVDVSRPRTLTAGGPGFYEPHGFTRGDTGILFTSNFERGTPSWGLDIFTMDLSTGRLENLTSSPRDWDEHAHYSPDFSQIVWMSSRDCNCDVAAGLKNLKTDLWVMNADGSNKRRLTYFAIRVRLKAPGGRLSLGIVPGVLMAGVLSPG